MDEEQPGTVVVVDPIGELECLVGDDLREVGFEVTAVESAGEVLVALDRGGIAGIVSRQRLPDLSGVQLLRSVRLFHPNLPVVIVPEAGDDGLPELPANAGASAVADPSAGPEKVRRVVSEQLGTEAEWVDRESEDRYRHLIANVPVPINLFDRSGQSIWCNQAVLDLLGLENREEFIGRSIVEFIHPEDRDIAHREIEGVIDEKESVGPTEMRLLRPDGEVREIRVSTAIGRFLDADIGQAVAVDLTDLHRTRRKLEEEQAFVEAALDAIPDVFYVLDREGRLLRWNEPTVEVTRYGPDELDGMSAAAFFDEPDRDRITASIEAVLEAGQDAVDATLVTRDGTRIPYEFRGRRLRTGAEDQVRVVGIGRDVSERFERENQLRAFEQWLRHNIRNDLTVIDGYAERLASGEAGDPSAVVELIKARSSRLVEQADHQGTVVELITEPSARRDLDVRSVVDGVLESLRERFPEAVIEVAGPPTLEAIAVPELSMAVEELVENAILHHDGETPQVTIELVDDDPVSIRIADDGPGIPATERGVLDVGHEVGPLDHGSGLGLALVYWVVRNSGGRIEVEDREPKGSVVTVSLDRPSTS